MAKSRKLVLTIVGVALLLTVAAKGHAGPIKIALDTPRDLKFSGIYVWAKAFSDHLTARGLDVTIYDRDTIGGEEEKVDMLMQGALEITASSDIDSAGKLDPLINGFMLPHLFDDWAHLDRALAKHGGLLEKVNAGLTPKGLRVLAFLELGSFGGLANSKKTIKTPDDLKGMRFRSIGKNQAAAFEAWGASTVVIPMAELYNALQTGVAHGCMSTPTMTMLFKLNEVLKYYSDINCLPPIRPSLCSEKWYRTLTDKERAIIHEGAAKASLASRAWVLGIEKTEIEQLRKTGVQVYLNSPKEIAQFAKLSQLTYATGKILPADLAKTFVELADATRK